MINTRSLASVRFASAFALLVGALLCNNSLFGIQGVESALVLGAVLPPWAAAIGTRVVITARAQPEPHAATKLLWKALSAAWSVLAIPVVLLALNALRVRNCTPFDGVMFMLLGPFASVTLGAMWGVAAGSAVASPPVATMLALAGPLLDVVLALARFHGTPAIFAYGHFFGFFPGTLYDEALAIPTPLITLRAVTLALSVGLSCLVIGHWDETVSRLRLRPVRSILFGLTAMACFGIAVAAETHAEAFGYTTSPAWIEQQLGRSLDGARCRVVVPRELNLAEAERLRDDCDFRVEQMERLIGVHQRQRVTAFFFRSPDEKRALMGAATTYIAKPWRNEVYLQLAPWPHPVLAHEIAHVVAGNLARGPFHVAARLNGWWPEASLIEGLAVAAAWDASDGMTPHQWARAMVDLGLAPRIHDLLGTGFLSQPKERAYTLAGSFLRFIAETRGWSAVRTIYRSGNLSPLHETTETLESQWLAFVRTVALPPSGVAFAAQRFARGSIFSRVCPHSVANIRLSVQGDLAANDLETATASCRTLLEIDPADTWARTTLLTALAKTDHLDDAMRELQALIGPPPAAPPTLWAARHVLADAAWRSGNTLDALKRYDELLREPQGEDATRLLEAKVLALQSPQDQAAILFDVLVGRDGLPPDPPSTMYLAERLSQQRHDGFGKYLAARQLFYAQRFDLAARLMEEAISAGLPTRLLTLAALRVLGISQLGNGKLEQSTETWKRFRSLGDAPHALEARDWLQRALWSEHQLASQGAH